MCDVGCWDLVCVEDVLLISSFLASLCWAAALCRSSLQNVAFTGGVLHVVPTEGQGHSGFRTEMLSRPERTLWFS